MDKFYKIINDNTELKYKKHLRGFRIDNVFKHLLLFICISFFLAMYLPNSLISLIVYFMIVIVMFIFLFKDIFKRKTIISINDERICFSFFNVFKKLYGIYEVDYNNIRYISYGGFIKSINIDFIDQSGKLVSFKIQTGKLYKNDSGYKDIIDRVTSMQKAFDRGDF